MTASCEAACQRPCVCDFVAGRSGSVHERADGVQGSVANGSWRNQAAHHVLGQWGMPIVPAWNDTVPLWEFHRYVQLVVQQ